MKERSCCLANILGNKEADNGNSEQTGSQNLFLEAHGVFFRQPLPTTVFN